MVAEVLEGFERVEVAALGATRVVWRLGSGPCVLVLAELPGITPRVVDFARRLSAAGMSVSLPHLFGEDGREPTSGYLASSFLRACISREFTVLATGRSSPVVEWLRALAHVEHERCGGPGVGVVGMCFTGGFGLAMLADAPVLAPVLAEPSLPLPIGRRRAADVGCSVAELAAARQKLAGGARVLGLRFTHDPAVRAERFETLRRELGDRFVSVELDSSPGNPYGYRKGAHSVLTEDFVDRDGSPSRDAMATVVTFLRDQLGLSRAA